ncbi:hypothetical protein INS49_005148 [Diaporthe citri]|uniref:uncharacterized protein n=1 Tax=Diaporthe citri TaxID=83186 RepID=UPI001C7F96D2|nr:uncharacterized protein INS49_005148 [Diaporthe citri]KAG6353891.1 hypothetical protein INS49_005148 [Diaporthe citri]
MPRVLLSTRQSHQGISTVIWALRGNSRGTYQHDQKHAGFALVRRASSVAFSSPAYSQYPASAKRASKAADVIAVGDHVDVPEDEVTSFSEELKEGIAETVSRKRVLSASESPTVDYPSPGSHLYGKWQSLSLDHERLLIESDINVSDSRLVRLIDQPGNESDIELWSCLLEFCHRWMGRDGVIMIWQAVSKRRNLHQVEGALPQAFWRVILSAAVTSDTFLREVISYGEWLLENHGTPWPQLYSTVVSFMLKNRPRAEVLRWHMTLSPSFGPGEVEFVDMLKKFITHPDPKMQETLRLLYSWSTHRKLYDILIPHLYDRGHAQLANQWRRLLIVHGDSPASLAARPFLRYVGAYYPQTQLSEEELSIAGLVLQDQEGSRDETVSHSLHAEAAINGQNLSYLVNRVHGETFGIREKPYNDKLGSKWFASTWVPLDFAISVIYTMGINGIGPLSLQSIALREGNAQGVLHRMDQLHQLKIKLPDTNYVAAIRHYATVGDNEALQELLHCDIHPDIFDDEVAQKQLLKHCLITEDWGTYQLLLKTRLAVTSHSVSASSDKILQSCARQGNGPMALALLHGMCSRNLQPAPMTSHLLSSFVLQNLSPHAEVRNVRQHVNLQLSLCRQLSITRFPPAVEAWQTLLYRLGREQRLIDLERLSLDILRLFVNYTKSDTPMWISHMADIPQILRLESPYQYFQKLPRDLPLNHEGHPLRQIFDKNLQGAIVRWGFTHTKYSYEAEASAYAVLHGEVGESAEPSDFHFARGIRLLAMLRDQGLSVPHMTIRKQAVIRLRDLYRGGGDARYEWVGGSPQLKMRRVKNQLSLSQAKKLCDLAWGREVVPSLPELMTVLENAMRDDKLNDVQARLRALEENSGRGR